MIDEEGYRPNVGIIITNGAGQLFWARRIGEDAWQFPQGGIQRNETPEQALFRELREEIGLHPDDVEVLGCTRQWLRYRLPQRYIRRGRKPVCIGQKQVWFLLRLVGSEEQVSLNHSGEPEFDHWRWISYWEPARQVISFKRRVYERALAELEPLMAELAAESAG
ncbi:MAG TPA: RNA pyrophosphohydrolase [Gammaproteobacteria bacterium]|nr:RNA pyrophosphohydrolase [Gammaproteobacteria bacterium]